MKNYILIGLFVCITFYSNSQIIEFYKCSFLLNCEESTELTYTQNHSLSANGDTLAVIARDSLFLIDFNREAVVNSINLSFLLESDSILASYIDYTKEYIHVFYLHSSNTLKAALFNFNLNLINTYSIKTQEWIFLINFVGQTKQDYSKFIFTDYGVNKESLIIEKKGNKDKYIEYDKSKFFHINNGFITLDENYVTAINKQITSDTRIENYISYDKFILVFCNKNDICELAIFDKPTLQITKKIKFPEYDIFRTFNFGISWYQDGVFYRLKIPN